MKMTLVTIQSDDPGVLEEFRAELSAVGETVGEVEQQTAVVDFPFDVGTLTETVASVLAAIKTLDGAAKTIIWLLKMIEKSRNIPAAPGVVVRIDNITFVLKNCQPAEVESKLKELFKVEE